jgi:transcriptional regulator with GAF, ATPase, and Fis domain
MTTPHGILGVSAAVARLLERIERVAASRSTVLITGESGTGKELVARALHQGSPQRHKPFIKINCAAIPDGLLESELFGHVRGAFTGAATHRRGKFALADQGSILLDEIGTMSPALQAKLLRVLQEREIDPIGAERSEPVDVRVIAATNRNLRQLVDQRLFLADLYYRLHVIPIHVAPLRERRGDIPLLVDAFIRKHAARNGRTIEGLEPGVMSWMQAYEWPGNIRELENTIERAVVLAPGTVVTRDVVSVEPGHAAEAPEMPSLRLRQNVEWAERETMRRALALSGEKRQAAELMGISPRALSYYLAKYRSGADLATLESGASGSH